MLACSNRHLAAIQRDAAATVVGFPYNVYAGETDPVQLIDCCCCAALYCSEIADCCTRAYRDPPGGPKEIGSANAPFPDPY